MAFIIAASCSPSIIAEWKKVNSGFYSPEIHHDYALMKVLYHLRRHNNAKTYINHIQWTGSPPPLNFNNLTTDDTIYIVGHGNEQGLYNGTQSYPENSWLEPASPARYTDARWKPEERRKCSGKLTLLKLLFSPAGQESDFIYH